MSCPHRTVPLAYNITISNLMVFSNLLNYSMPIDVRLNHSVQHDVLRQTEVRITLKVYTNVSCEYNFLNINTQTHRLYFRNYSYLFAPKSDGSSRATPIHLSNQTKDKYERDNREGRCSYRAKNIIAMYRFVKE